MANIHHVAATEISCCQLVLSGLGVRIFSQALLHNRVILLPGVSVVLELGVWVMNKSAPIRIFGANYQLLEPVQSTLITDQDIVSLLQYHVYL